MGKIILSIKIIVVGAVAVVGLSVGSNLVDQGSNINSSFFSKGKTSSSKGFSFSDLFSSDETKTKSNKNTTKKSYRKRTGKSRCSYLMNKPRGQLTANDTRYAIKYCLDHFK